jgi:hypothetical protein
MNPAAGAFRRWSGIVVLAAVIIAAGVVIALLTPPTSAPYLDPSGTSDTGGRALANLLASRGQHLVRESAPAAAGPASAAPGASLELITSPQLLTSEQLSQAARFGGDILLLGPDSRALRALAPRVRIVGSQVTVAGAEPACAAAPAVLAGDAYLSGAMLSTVDPAVSTCYPSPPNGPGYLLVQYRAGSRTITVLGSGAPLTNQYLAQAGDAALALNLLRQAGTITWIVPPPGALPAQAAAGQRSFFSLVPWPAYLIAIQLAIAALLAAAWRARRLGPLVPERIPVIVRATETVEGHGRLYQARRARDRAAGELRSAATTRIARLTGGDVSAGTLAVRTGEDARQISALLEGPPPASDQELVTLADQLDTLMRKIRTP